MMGEDVVSAIEPFTDSIKDLDKDKDPVFLGRKVKTGFVVLVFEDGTAVRGAISVVGDGTPEHWLLASAIIEETFAHTFKGDMLDGNGTIN